MEAFFKAFLVEMKEMQDSIYRLKGDLGTFKDESQGIKTNIADIFAELTLVKEENIVIRKQMKAENHSDGTNENSMEGVKTVIESNGDCIKSMKVDKSVPLLRSEHQNYALGEDVPEEVKCKNETEKECRESGDLPKITDKEIKQLDHQMCEEFIEYRNDGSVKSNKDMEFSHETQGSGKASEEMEELLPLKEKPEGSVEVKQHEDETDKEEFETAMGENETEKGQLETVKGGGGTEMEELETVRDEGETKKENLETSTGEHEIEKEELETAVNESEARREKLETVRDVCEKDEIMSENEKEKVELAFVTAVGDTEKEESEMVTDKGEIKKEELDNAMGEGDTGKEDFETAIGEDEREKEELETFISEAEQPTDFTKQVIQNENDDNIGETDAAVKEERNEGSISDRDTVRESKDPLCNVDKAIDLPVEPDQVKYNTETGASSFETIKQWVAEEPKELSDGTEETVGTIPDESERESIEPITIKKETPVESEEPTCYKVEDPDKSMVMVQYENGAEENPMQCKDDVENESVEQVHNGNENDLSEVAQCKNDNEESLQCEDKKDKISSNELSNSDGIEVQNDLVGLEHSKSSNEEYPTSSDNTEYIQENDKDTHMELEDPLHRVDGATELPGESGQLKDNCEEEHLEKIQSTETVKELRCKDNKTKTVRFKDDKQETLAELEPENRELKTCEELMTSVSCEYGNGQDLVQSDNEIKEKPVETLQCNDDREQEQLSTKAPIRDNVEPAEEFSEAIKCNNETDNILESIHREDQTLSVRVKEPEENQLVCAPVQGMEREDAVREDSNESNQQVEGPKVELMIASQNEDESEDLTQKIQPSEDYGEQIIKLDKKVTKSCAKVQRSINDFKIEFSREMIKVQENSNKVAQLQRVFNIVHCSMQAKKDAEEKQSAASVALPLLPSVSLKDLKHPSKVGISRSDAKKMLENIKKAAFCVMLKEMPLLCNVAVCIEEYTKVEKQSDYMDPVSGIYTIPLQGRYEFRIGRTTASYKVEIYLCIGKDKKRMDVSSNSQENNGFYYRTVYLDCEVNDKVWLEAAGRQQGYNDTLSAVVFRGKKIV